MASLIRSRQQHTLRCTSFLTIYLLEDHAKATVQVAASFQLLAVRHGLALVRGLRGAHLAQLAAACEATLAAEVTGWPSLAGKDLRVNDGLGGRGRDGRGCACEDEEGGDELHWEMVGGRVGHVFGVVGKKKIVGSMV